MKKKTPAQKAYSRIKKHFLAYKTIDKVSDKDLPVFVPIGRGHLNKKAVGIMNKCMENNSEQQIIIKNASKKLTKEILKTGIGKQVQLKEHAPLGNVPIYYNEIKKPVKVIKKGYTLTPGVTNLRHKAIDKWLTKNAIKPLPTINEREAELGNAPKGTIHNPCSSIAEAYETIGNKDGAVVFVKSGVLTPKKKRIPTRFSAKKLKEKHKDLWKTIEKLVYIDIDMLTEIYNGRRNIDEKKARTIAHNAAFTAIVEMIKRGLL